MPKINPFNTRESEGGGKEKTDKALSNDDANKTFYEYISQK